MTPKTQTYFDSTLCCFCAEYLRRSNIFAKNTSEPVRGNWPLTGFKKYSDLSGGGQPDQQSGNHSVRGLNWYSFTQIASRSPGLTENHIFVRSGSAERFIECCSCWMKAQCAHSWHCGTDAITNHSLLAKQMASQRFKIKILWLQHEKMGKGK